MITSTSNEKIKQVKALQARAKARRETMRFVVEGVRLAEEALAAGVQPALTLYSPDLNQRGLALIDQLAAAGAPIDEVAPVVLAAASETETSQGILLVLPIPTDPPPDSLDFALIVDQVRDPGNLGTLLRTAAAMAVGAVILLPGTVDVYSPKVVRAGMGAHFQVPLLQLETQDLAQVLETHDLILLLAEASAQQNYSQLDLTQPVALVVGGEAEGPSRALHQLPHTAVRIPMPGRAESLNAGVAGSILMAEVARQRAEPEQPQ